MNIGFSKFGFPGFPLNYIFYYINGTHNKSIQIDMILKYMFHPGVPGTCLRKSTKNHKMLLRNILSILDTFIKTFSRKSRIENILKYHIYLDIFVMSASYVIKYRI